MSFSAASIQIHQRAKNEKIYHNRKIASLSCLLGVFFVSSMAGAAEPPSRDVDMPDVPTGKAIIVSIEKMPKSLREKLKNSPDFSQQAAGKDFIAADERSVTRVDAMIRAKRLPSELEGNLLFDLAKFDGKFFSAFELVGFFPSSPDMKGPWDEISRLFTSKDGKRIMLTERDFTKDGGGVVMYSELLNVNIGGVPGKLTARVAPSGKTLWSITWASKENKMFKLYVQVDTFVFADRDYLLALANEIRD